MLSSLSAIICMATATAVAVVILAVGVGKLTPASSASRTRGMPGQLEVRGTFAPSGEASPRFLDAETGVIRQLRLPASDRLDQASVAPWRDASGGSQVAGRGSRRAGRDAEPGLARYSFPEGEPLDRVPTDRPPTSPPCWLKGLQARVLFAAGDGALYRHDFEEADGSPASSSARPVPVAWGIRPPGLGRVHVADPCWPGEATPSDCILVSLREEIRDAKGKRLGEAKIWWLGMDADARTIVAAGRLFPDGPGRSNLSERCPSYVGPRGREAIAFLTHGSGTEAWEVRIAPVAFDKATHAPIALPRAAILLAEGCAPVAPQPSPDGLRLAFIGLGEAGRHGYVRTAPTPVSAEQGPHRSARGASPVVLPRTATSRPRPDLGFGLDPAEAARMGPEVAAVDRP